MPEGTDNFSAPDILLYIQRKLGDVLNKQKGLEKQRFTDDRRALQYLAFEVYEKSTRYVHLRQRPADELAEEVRNDLMDVLRTRSMTTAFESSPLWGQGTKVPESAHDLWRVHLDPGKDRWDLKLFEAVAGADLNRQQGITHVHRLLEESVPYLTTLDASQVRIQAADVRGKMWDLLKGKTGLYEELREELLQIMLDEWCNSSLDPMEAVEIIEKELLAERLPQRRRELSCIGDRGVDSLLKQRSLMPRGTLEEKINRVVQHEKERMIVPVAGNDPRVVIDAYFGTLLAKKDVTEEDRETCIRRLPVFEMMLVEAVQGLAEMRQRHGGVGYESHELHQTYNDAISTFMQIQEHLRVLESKYHLSWHDHPSLGYAQIISAIYADNVNPNTLRGIL